VLLAANRAFHQLLVNGVPVEYQQDGETRGDFVRLVDFADVGTNEWLAVNQFSIKGAKYTRRPDIVLFVNGLPLVLLELKNPADENADIWKAYHQLQTYKEQIPDLFQYNEILVISDGTEARLGSLSANMERFMAWRTIDGHARPAGAVQRTGNPGARRAGSGLPAGLPCASSSCSRMTAPWSRRSPGITSSMRCARPSIRWWRHPAPAAAARGAWSGIPKARARASP
jgi:hypothetical protein